jgi:hypothetical protein
MEIAALSDAIGESFLFEEIDGQGRLFSKFGSALTGMLMPYWIAGSLYGQSPDQAFIVDVGPSVNTPTTIADNQLNAAIALRPSPFAEWINININKQLVTQSLN